MCSVVWFGNLCWSITPWKQPKSISCVKGEGMVDHNKVTKRLKKCSLLCRNLEDQVRSGWPKIKNLEAVLQLIEVNPMSSNQRVSGSINAQRYCVQFWTNSGSSSKQNSWYMATSHYENHSNRTYCWRTHKRWSPVDNYLWTHQYRLIRKKLLSSALLCRPSRVL